jgi:ATP-dependent RNA helicase DDX27
MQCAEVVSVLGKFTDVRCCCIIGGVSLSKQEIDLRAQPEVIVATPGRLIDLLRNSQARIATKSPLSAAPLH